MVSFALNQFIPLPLPDNLRTPLHPRHIHNLHNPSHAAVVTLLFMRL